MLAAQALVFFAFGLWGISGTRLVVPAFYALEDTKTPVRVALFSFALNFLLSLILMGPVTVGQDAGGFARGIAAISQTLGVFSLSHGGLALANSISSTCQFLVLLHILHGRLGQFAWREFSISFLRNLFNALLMALPLILVVRSFDWVGMEGSLIIRSALFILIMAGGVILYVALSFLFRSPERHVIVQAASVIRRRATNQNLPSS
jgi:putative peptidoglycan lipid II flippase